MLTYLPALLRASQALLKGLSEDPSAWGVSAAFMRCENQLESAMVAWSGVAGQFFSKKRTTRSWRRSLSRSSSNSLTHLRRGSIPSSPSSMDMSPIGSMSMPMLLMGDRVKEEAENNRDGIDSEKTEKVEEGDFKALSDKPKKDVRQRKLSVRDLAIQPTQRVMRYVLLYRGEYTARNFHAIDWTDWLALLLL
jgi:hypothetical protein